MNPQAAIADRVVEAFGERLTASPRLAHDAVTLEFGDDLAMQARFASDDEYSIEWQRGAQRFRIDTAPLHRGLASFPNHFHDADGSVHADLLTRPGAAPWDNLRAVLEMVLAGRDRTD
jgi:hypothetical protein